MTDRPEWRIYYGDGTTYNGDPFHAPTTNVQVIGQANLGLIQGKSAYCWRGNGWIGCDEAGMWDYLLMHPGPKAVLFGRTTVRNEDFWACVRRAKADYFDR